MPFDLVAELQARKNKLNSVTTKVTHVDGSQLEEKRQSGGKFEEVEEGEDGKEVVVSNRRRKKVERLQKMGFVVDLKPDLQVAKACEGVYLSSQDVATDFNLLKANGITHIVNAACGVGNFFPKNFYYLNVDWLDLPETKILSELEFILTYMHNAASSGAVLVHCNAGVSRAGTIVLAYMMKYKKLKFETALYELRKVRPAVQPNAGFRAQLIEFEKQLFGQ